MADDPSRCQSGAKDPWGNLRTSQVMLFVKHHQKELIICSLAQRINFCPLSKLLQWYLRTLRQNLCLFCTHLYPFWLSHHTLVSSRCLGVFIAKCLQSYFKRDLAQFKLRSGTRAEHRQALSPCLCGEEVHPRVIFMLFGWTSLGAKHHEALVMN